MTPTDFEFSVEMPGDVRLLGAVRQLAAHAAGYAQLTAEAGQGFARLVERATEAAMAVLTAPQSAISLRFAGSGRAIDVLISCDAMSTPTTHHPVSPGGVSVQWQSDGSRQTCHIRQPLPA